MAAGMVSPAAPMQAFFLLLCSSGEWHSPHRTRAGVEPAKRASPAPVSRGYRESSRSASSKAPVPVRQASALDWNVGQKTPVFTSPGRVLRAGKRLFGQSAGNFPSGRQHLKDCEMCRTSRREYRASPSAVGYGLTRGKDVQHCEAPRQFVSTVSQ
jgi:hypothetical protein